MESSYFVFSNPPGIYKPPAVPSGTAQGHTTQRARGEIFKLSLTGSSCQLDHGAVPPEDRAASRAGSESGAAAGRGGLGGAAARHWQPLPEPQAGGTATLQEILVRDDIIQV